ncbi:MAG: hypothetical protein M1822_003988 [Bathelium mastoideum]|nr:MAG: hypothetical protein M1822_003988 [Bathelium mastoideum]
MVAISQIQASNALITSSLPSHLVAVFVGATAGIGEATLKEFAKRANEPRVYFVGRSESAGNRILTECKALNSKGHFEFIQADVSLIRNVDKVSNDILAKESTLNLLFLSQGQAIMDGSETLEHLPVLASLNFYSRMRFIQNFLPLLQKAPALRRVVSVAGGSKEGTFDTTDFSARAVPLLALRGHLTTLITLGLEAVAKRAPEVSLVHDYPGTVMTSLFDQMPGPLGFAMRTQHSLRGWWNGVPIEEVGERQVYLATSSQFPPPNGENAGVPLQGVEAAPGIRGEVGSGVYSIDWDCESASESVQKLLTEYLTQGLDDKILNHTESEFKRILTSNGGE